MPLMFSVDWALLWRRHRIHLCGVLGYMLIIILLAWLFPLPSASWQPAVQRDGKPESGLPLALGKAHRQAIRKLTRWGKSVEQTELELVAEATNETASEHEKSAGRQLIGILGLISVGEERYMLYRTRDGETRRLEVGGLVPDGRRLLTVGETAAMLEDDPGSQKVVHLFPPLFPSDGESVQ